MPAFAPVFEPQLATDAIITEIANDASAPAIVKSGAVNLSGGFPRKNADPTALGTKIDVPYFNLPGEGQDVDTLDTAVTFNEGVPSKQQAAIKIWVYGWKYNDWVKLTLEGNGDPYSQLAKIVVQKKWNVAIAKESITQMNASALSLDKSASTITYDALVDALAMFGDQEKDIAAFICHSAIFAAMRKVKNANGDPILLKGSNGESGPAVGPAGGDVWMILDKYPVVVSDLCPVAPAAGEVPTKYTSFFAKKDSVLYWYEPGGFNVQEFKDITVTPTVNKFKIEVYKANHLYHPYPGSTYDGVVKLITQ